MLPARHRMTVSEATWHGDGRLYVQSGIVCDFDLRKEWNKTMSKKRALLRVVAEARQGS